MADIELHTMDNSTSESDMSSGNSEYAEEQEQRDELERQANEKHIDDLLEIDEDGNIRWDVIEKTITPQNLTKCKTSSLEKALEVSHKLRRLAHFFSKRENLMDLANSVEDYALNLLDPLKRKIDKMLCPTEETFRYDFDRVSDAAIHYEQKKFISHYVTYKHLINRWKGEFYKIQIRGSSTRKNILWIFLNFWNVLDAFFFPIPYVLLYLINKIVNIKGCKDKTKVDYPKYFETPYFIFFRDFVSYLILLGLHFAKCLQPSTLHFTVLEWIVMVFFLGRILAEVNEMINGGKFKEKTVPKGGEKIEEKEEEKQTKRGKHKAKFKTSTRYFNNYWNVLDVVILVVYVIYLILRVVTWSSYTSVSYNRLLAVAGYIFGFNTMILTLRVFGHILEVFSLTGSIQIALFQIIGASVTVLGQFIAVVLAFSLAITKIYITEVSYITASNVTSPGLCRTKSALACWWSYTTHLTWSLLGGVDLQPLQSSDDFSDTLAQLLYCLFLIMSVVMLMNMMIALLTNTYQQVEDNSFNEWSYRKASTIQMYCTHHPVPVPFNIISLSFIFLRYIYRKVKGVYGYKLSNINYHKERSHENEAFHNLMLDLEDQYFSVHGNAFPMPVNKKIDHVLKEVCGSQQLIGHIAQNAFLRELKEAKRFRQERADEILDVNWESHGILVDGHALTYVDCCETCKHEGNTKDFHGHGARYPFPLDEIYPGFEVLINKTKEKRAIAIGVVPWEYESLEFPCSGWGFPGWYESTVGYHVNNGKIYDEDNPNFGRASDDGMAYKGDMIGCRILFERRKNQTLPVIFTLNGRVIGKAKLKRKANRPFGSFFPYVGIGWEGISLLFRLSFNVTALGQRVEKEPKEISEHLNYLIEKQEAVDKKLDFIIRNLAAQNTLV